MSSTMSRSSSVAAGASIRPWREITCERPWCSSGLRIGSSTTAAVVEVRRQRHAGAQRIAQAGDDEVAQRAERSGRQQGRQPHAFADLGRLDVLAHPEAALQRGPRVRQQVGQPQRPAQARQRMGLEHQRLDRLRVRLVGAQPLVPGRLEQQPDVGPLVDHPAHDLVAAADFEARP